MITTLRMLKVNENKFQLIPKTVIQILNNLINKETNINKQQPASDRQLTFLVLTVLLQASHEAAPLWNLPGSKIDI